MLATTRSKQAIPKTRFTHDKFFKTCMTDLRVAREFFSVYLPDDLNSIVDLNQLRLEPRSFINDIRKETTVDLLFKTKAADQDMYLLVEHQSSVDILMPFRIIKYICNIMDQHINFNLQKTLPFVYPIVLYHAKQLYPYSTEINDLVKLPKAIVDKYLFKPFQLIDLNYVDYEKLKHHPWCGAIEYAFKHIFSKDIEPHVAEFNILFANLKNAGGEKYIQVVIQYLAEYCETKNAQINRLFGEPAMPIYEMWIEQGKEEGREEGREEGKIELAKQMLQEGVDASLITKYLRSSSLEKLK